MSTISFYNQENAKRAYLAQLHAALANPAYTLGGENYRYTRAQAALSFNTTPQDYVAPWLDEILLAKFNSMDIVSSELVTLIDGVTSDIQLPQISHTLTAVPYACDLEPDGDILNIPKQIKMCPLMIAMTLCPEELVNTFVSAWYTNWTTLPEQVSFIVAETLLGFMGEAAEANYFQGNPDAFNPHPYTSCYGWLKMWLTDGVVGGPNINTPVGTAPVTAANAITVLNQLLTTAPTQLKQLINLGYQNSPVANRSSMEFVNTRARYVCSPTTQVELMEGIRQSATAPISESHRAMPNAYKGIAIDAYAGMPDDVVVLTYVRDRQGHSNYLFATDTQATGQGVLLERISGQHVFKAALTWRQGAQVKEAVNATVWGDIPALIGE